MQRYVRVHEALALAVRITEEIKKDPFVASIKMQRDFVLWERLYHAMTPEEKHYYRMMAPSNLILPGMKFDEEAS
jgi:hypothetical protein